MKHTLPPLNWLRAFECSARHSSFASAANELNLTSAAISYQVRSLEEHLGFKLFERLPRGLRLTDIGRAYLPSLRKAFDDISMSTVGLFGADEKKVLTVRVPMSYGALCLLPRLPEFKTQYSSIDIRVFTAVWADRPADDDADLEIRYGDGKWQGWDTQRLTNDRSVVVSTVARGADQSAADYLQAQSEAGIIQIMGCEDLWTRLLRLHGLTDTRTRVSAIADNSFVALEMAAGGMGTTLVSECFAAPYLEAGRIATPVETELPVEQGHYVLIPEGNDAKKPEALLFREWLLQTFAEDYGLPTASVG